MPTRDDVKRAVCEAIDRQSEKIVAVGDTIRKNPELGFKEFKTSRLVEDTMREIGLQPKGGLAITGVRGEARGKKDGPTFALLGELDALVVAGHPVADPQTGAAHACGHNAQVASMLGAAMGLVGAKAFEHLAGRVVFFAVPAEEYGDVAWRVEQARAGKLEFLGGKPELLRLGHFDDVDMAMMIHLTPQREYKKAGLAASNNGCIVKTVRYMGRASHAGGAPHMGINALYAAHIGLAAINAIRETFKDEDSIRVHPIITHGGSQVNVIPADVRIETYVRGKSVEAILDANVRVDRALKAGALALGAQVEIETLPGYLPLFNHDGMGKYFSLHRRLVRQRPRRRLHDHGSQARLHRERQAACPHGRGHALGRCPVGQGDHRRLQATPEPGGLSRLPARHQQDGALRRGEVDIACSDGPGYSPGCMAWPACWPQLTEQFAVGRERLND